MNLKKGKNIKIKNVNVDVKNLQIIIRKQKLSK